MRSCTSISTGRFLQLTDPVTFCIHLAQTSPATETSTQISRKSAVATYAKSACIAAALK